MYAKVFSQIFDSSIANDYQLRQFFTDLLVLAESDGVIDMTPEAVSARTRIPLELVTRFLHELEQPDPQSRTHVREGRRIVRIDAQRAWGWKIVNYIKYRETASEEQRRHHTKQRTRKWRERNALRRPSGDACVTHGDIPVTGCDACDAIQKKKKIQKDISTPIPPGGFVDFWEAYPRREGRKKALAAWIKEKCEPIAGSIILAVGRHKESSQWKKDGGRFIPHATTWLNGRRWEDEVQKASDKLF